MPDPTTHHLVALSGAIAVYRALARHALAWHLADHLAATSAERLVEARDLRLSPDECAERTHALELAASAERHALEQLKARCRALAHDLRAVGAESDPGEVTP